MLTRYFTVTQVEQKRSLIQNIVLERVGAMEKAGPPVDLVRMFALPVPAIVICDFLGVARTERDGFEVPSRIIADIFGTTTDAKKAANRDLYAFAWRVIEEKRARPGDDLLSEVILTGDLSDDELKGLVRLLFPSLDPRPRQAQI
jgi:cytochrome P450